ncbi:MAG TPA: hypothetical protein PLJ00_05855 [Chitinophagales bacterium]|nr:hypothetical protein [Chitinophagales bacterium]
MKKFLTFLAIAWARITSFKIGPPSRNMIGIFLAASTGRKFTSLQAGGGTNESVGIGMNYADVLALSSKLGITGQNGQTYVAVMITSAGVQTFRAKEDGSIQIRPVANKVFNFTTGGNLAFVDDAGVIRNVSITGNIITLDYVRFNGSNLGLSRSYSAGAFFMDLDFNAANAAGAQTLRVFHIKPTINDTGTATGDFVFIDYAPVVTALVGRHYAFRATAGDVIIGGSSANAAAKVQIDSTTQGFLKPRMTTVQRDAISTPPAGLEIYNTTTNKMNFYNGSAWEVITSA